MQNKTFDLGLTWKMSDITDVTGTSKKDLILKNNYVAKILERYEILDIVSELSSDYFFQLSLYKDTFKVDWVKGKFEEITGYPAEFVADLKKWVAVIHPDDVHLIENGIQKVLSNQSSAVEYRFKSKGGELKWLRDYTKPIWDEKQKRVTKIISAVKDITKTKVGPKS